MSIKNYILPILLLNLVLTQTVLSQDTIPSDFEPYGNPIMRIYSNLHSGFSGNEPKSGIEVTRAYLGYEYFISENFTAIIKLDIGSSKDADPITSLKRYAYFKSASINYKNNGLTINFGLIDTRQFKAQEKHWGHRYIFKSFMDEYKYAPSADLGASIEYKFNDKFSADLSFMNGEGYQTAQLDDAFETVVGLSFFPAEKWTIRAFVDYYEKKEIENTAGAFVGYKADKVLLGGEFNYKKNVKFKNHHDSWGVSAYASYFVTHKFQVFGRYDYISTNVLKDEVYSWNWDDDGSKIIAGVQFNPVDKLKIAIDYQGWIPYYSSLDLENFIYLNFEFNL
jgi:hypothetical protein